MRINNNLMALNTYNQMTTNNSNASKSIEKLSSGLRINSAADDAAGLAISEKMRSQIRGLDQASRNAQDGISMIQTAEGALDETEAILQRMRELSVQASNDTYTAEDREAIQDEVNQLNKEIDRIATDTEFNNKKLLDGNLENVVQVNTNASKATNIDVVDDNLESGDYTLTVDNVTTEYKIDGTNGTGMKGVAADTGGTKDIEPGEYELELIDNDGAGGDSYDVILRDSEGNEIERQTRDIDNSSGAVNFDIGGINIQFGDASGSDPAVAEGKTQLKVETDADFVLKKGSETIDTVIVSDTTSDTIEVGGIEVSIDDTLTAGDTTMTIDNNAVTYQIGANAGQTTNMSVSDMSSDALGVGELDLTTSEGATAAIDLLDDAINSVSSERSKLGAMQNRLDHTINNLNTSSENLTAAESRIRDVDMAKEMMEMTKWTTLQQSSNAMLSQANQQPQQVLQLLR
jgi:flagellin